MCVCVCVCVCVCACVHACVCVCVHVCVCVYLYNMYLCTHLHLCIRVHMYMKIIGTFDLELDNSIYSHACVVVPILRCQLHERFPSCKTSFVNQRCICAYMPHAPPTHTCQGPPLLKDYTFHMFLRVAPQKWYFCLYVHTSTGYVFVIG